MKARLCLLSLVAALAATSAAQTIRTEGPTLVVNEVPVLTLRATIAGNGPDRRVRAVAERLRKVPSGTSFRVRGSGRGREIIAGKAVILDIGPAEATAQRSRASSLAATWIANIQGALNLPPLRLASAEAVVPVGGKAAVGLVGSEAADAELKVEPAEAVILERKDGSLLLTGRAAADATITVTGKTGMVTLRLQVVPYAASLPQSVTLSVSGAPASAETVTGAIEGAIRQQLVAAPGRKIVLKAPQDVSVDAGTTRKVSVPVQVTAPGALPVEGTVEVSIRNEALAQTREEELWYCNDPESLKGPSVLFRTTLALAKPARMLYHHVNESSEPLFFTADVNNPSDLPARVLVIPGDSPPDPNPVRAGVLAADPFFRAWVTGSGEIVTIPPRSRMPLSLRRLAPKQTASGLCTLRLLPGGPASLVVTADAVRPFPLVGDWAAAEASPTPWREVGTPALDKPLPVDPPSVLVFPKPFRTEEVIYQVGGPFRFVRVGQKPIARQDGGRPLDGNFGVIYKVSATLTNPTQAAANVEVVFEASAGYSGALFFVDGEYQRKPLLQPKAESQLVRFRLAPGETRTVNISTIPLSGSSYPATIVLRPVQTLPPIK